MTAPTDLPAYCRECDRVVEGDIDWATGLCPYCGAWVRDPEPGKGATMESTGITMYTNAPAAYDYGRTTEARADTGWRLTCGIDQDKPLRQILIDGEYYAGIQKDRNLSGLYVTLTEAEYREWIKLGILRRADA